MEIRGHPGTFLLELDENGNLEKGTREKPKVPPMVEHRETVWGKPPSGQKLGVREGSSTRHMKQIMQAMHGVHGHVVWHTGVMERPSAQRWACLI